MNDMNNAIEIDPRIELEFIKLQAQCWRMQQSLNALVGENARQRAEIEELKAQLAAAQPAEAQKLDS